MGMTLSRAPESGRRAISMDLISCRLRSRAVSISTAGVFRASKFEESDFGAAFISLTAAITCLL